MSYQTSSRLTLLDLNLVITVPADGLASNGAGPSAGTVLCIHPGIHPTLTPLVSMASSLHPTGLSSARCWRILSLCSSRRQSAPGQLLSNCDGPAKSAPRHLLGPGANK